MRRIARITKNLFDAAEGSTMELTFRGFSVRMKAIWVQAYAILIRKREGNKPVYQAVITPTSVREKMYQNILDVLLPQWLSMTTKRMSCCI